MKILIIIPTCDDPIYPPGKTRPSYSEEQRRAACRDTWLRDTPIDYKFFYGHKENPLPDEVSLHIQDSYELLSHKTSAMVRWAMSNGYTHVLRVDTDAYVYTSRLLQSGGEAHEYTGYCLDYPQHLDRHRYACGTGFMLGTEAMTIVAQSTPSHPADDLWVGSILYRHGIRCYRDTRYLSGHASHHVDVHALETTHPYIVVHALTPDSMRLLHARDAGADITAPIRQWNEPDYDFAYGIRDKGCGCDHCRLLIAEQLGGTAPHSIEQPIAGGEQQGTEPQGDSTPIAGDDTTAEPQGLGDSPAPPKAAWYTKILG